MSEDYIKCIRTSSRLLLGLKLYADTDMYQQQKTDFEAYLEGEGSGLGECCFTSALCAGPHLLYAEQQVLVLLLRLRGRGGVAALHLHRTTCSSAA